MLLTLLLIVTEGWIVKRTFLSTLFSINGIINPQDHVCFDAESPAIGLTRENRDLKIDYTM